MTRIVAWCLGFMKWVSNDPSYVTGGKPEYPQELFSAVDLLSLQFLVKVLSVSLFYSAEVVGNHWYGCDCYGLNFFLILVVVAIVGVVIVVAIFGVVVVVDGVSSVFKLSFMIIVPGDPIGLFYSDRLGYAFPQDNGIIRISLCSSVYIGIGSIYNSRRQFVLPRGCSQYSQSVVRIAIMSIAGVVDVDDLLGRHMST
ncbi:hypothetical protein Tco_0091609 [Tanacetum coccineum]